MKSILIVLLLGGCACAQVPIRPAAQHDLGETTAHFIETEPSVHCLPVPVLTEQEKKKQAKEEARKRKDSPDVYEQLYGSGRPWELLSDTEKCAASQAVLTSGTGELRLTFFNTYVFKNSKLVEIRFTDTTTDSFTSDVEALTKRYGKPVNTTIQKAQNAYGATFEERGAIWDLPEGAQAVAAESVRWDDCNGYCTTAASYKTSTSVLIRTAEQVKEAHRSTPEVKF